jgi:hypothetical protein
MQKKRTILRLILLGVGLLIVFGLVMPLNRTEWTTESFAFASGPSCFVFVQPKVVLFFGDGGEEEIFDFIHPSGQSTVFVPPGLLGFSSGQSMANGVLVDSFTISFWGCEITHRFTNGDHVMVFSERGTKLTLADGRTFALDGITPLWLRCKSDGTVVVLDELPEGFVEFFEAPPDDPGLIESIKSYPDAFRK